MKGDLMSLFHDTHLKFEEVHDRTVWGRRILFLNTVVCMLIGIFIIVDIALHASNHHSTHYVDMTLSVLFFTSLVLVVTAERLEESRVSMLIERHRGEGD